MELAYVKLHPNSKEAIALPPEQRLHLLIRTEEYPVVGKRTSAFKQIEEMINLYDLCCVMLTKFFSNVGQQYDFNRAVMLACAEVRKVPVNDKILRALELLGSYENTKRKIVAIQRFFWNFAERFPDLAKNYNLRNRIGKYIPNIIKDTDSLLAADAHYFEEIVKKWKLM